MKKNEAEQLVTQTFTKSFSEKQFIRFARNLLPGMQPPSSRLVTGAQLKQGFQEHIHSYTRLGIYRDPQGDVLDVVVVKLKKRGALDRARTRQRNLMAHYLKDRSKGAVLVAYITDDPADWRFSFVKLAYQTEITDKGKVRAKREFTPARRYSFLVGENEPNHTAQKQLGDLLMQEGRLTLDQIEEAFNIESVTKKFFEDYKALFLQIKENMDQIVAANQQVKAEFESREIDTANFAKKLLGQIVFLYFMQKKGWLGVAKDAAWGTGDKRFLYNLFKNKEERNYFDDILEPFFYEALAIERKDDYYLALQCKVPFLNGGLFEPLSGYDWHNTHINLDNQVFEEIFKVFNLYNFTVREDEPLEKEVAVDPEMLGKVFENLLDITDRKSKGAYYTPREIVHYMCEESLINYLDTTMNSETQKVPKEDIETFIREGDTSLENDLAKEAGRKSGDYGLPENIRDHARMVDQALADVKICDPAIGSGAFPVGMMTEIVRARLVLTPYLTNQRNRDPYTFKWHCIENSLYGVDIEASAVEIAKLRLWLSLVVDEESYDHIRPLPNLDYRIVRGNSLLSVEKNLFNFSLYPELEKKKTQYFGTTSSRNKTVLRSEIDAIINELTNGKEIFDFEIYFNEVFSGNNGFDLVIGNPPYLGERGNKETFRQIAKNSWGKKYYVRKMDLFYFFIHLGLDISNDLGIISFITTNYYVSADGAEKLRRDIKERSKYVTIIDFGELRIFPSASGQHNMISILSRNKTDNPTLIIQTTRKGNADLEVLKNILYGNDAEYTIYTHRSTKDLFYGSLNSIYINNPNTGNYDEDLNFDFTKIEGVSNPLTVYSKSVFRGVETGCDKVTNLLIKSAISKKLISQNKARDFSVGTGIYVLTLREIELLELTPIEWEECVKPFYKNSEIEKYVTQKKNDKYLLYVDSQTDINRYPNVRHHLEKFKPLLAAREQSVTDEHNWYWIRGAKRNSYFYRKDMIVVPYRSRDSRFSLCNQDIFGAGDLYNIALLKGISTKLLLGYLNSSFIYFILSTRGKRKGEMIEYYKRPLDNLPIHKTLFSNAYGAEIEELVDKIIKNKVKDPLSDISQYELKIDEIIYQLYEFSEEEVAIIEESVGR